MSSQFLSSEEYDERAHQLYNEGQYDEALETLREGLGLYPHAVELHVGVGYARAAREEFAWARKAFEEALVLDPEHEDALAGLGEVLIKFGQLDAAVRCFRQTLELGYHDDVDLMLQIGRAAFREGLIEVAREFFEIAAQQVPDSAEAVALTGYAAHRLGDDDAALKALRKALQLDAEHVEARVYLANIVDEAEERASQNQLELFGTLLGELATQKGEPQRHEIVLRDGRRFEGTWDEIVATWRASAGAAAGRSLAEFMANEARRGFSITGAKIPSNDAEAFLRASANAGLLRIVT